MNPSFWLVETIFYPFLVKALSVQCTLIFQQILHSGQQKLLFWPAKTILFQYLKNSFHWKQFFRNIFQTNPLLQTVATDFLFSGNDVLPFTFFWKPLLQLVGNQNLKNVLFLLEEIVFFLLFQIAIRISFSVQSRKFKQQKYLLFKLPWFSEIKFFKEYFVLASGNGFLINYTLCGFIRSFFLLVNTILQIRCKPVLFDFFYS